MTRRILVTGANKGIGLAIAEAILSEHADTFVLLGSRDADRGEAARDQLVAAHPAWRDRVQVVALDVSSDVSVATAATQIGPPLYAIVNNAGIGLGGQDGRQVVDTNTFGVRRVCDAFLPLLDPERGRIVNVTSGSAPNFVATCSPDRQQVFVDPAVTWDRLVSAIDESLTPDNAYGLSKACANAYTMILAREHPRLRINACTPGFIETDMTRRYASAQGKSAAEMGMKSPAEGARAAMFLLFGEPEGNGRYYGSDAQRSPLDRYRAPGTPPYTGE